MKIQYAYKFRLVTTLEQTELLTQSAGCVCKVWNEFLANEIVDFDLAKEKGEKRFFPSYEDNCKKLTLLKKFLPYLKEAPSQALQQTLKNLSKAFKGFYEGRTGFPTFKKKSKVKAIHFPQGFKLFKDETGKNGKVFLPTLGYFDFIQHRTIPEDFKVKNVYVRQHGKHWYVSFQGEKINSNKEKKLFKCFALDLGIKHFLTSQNNEIIKPLNKLQDNLDKLKFLQQKLSKKTKGSNSWQKLVDRINKLHIHIANCRKDFNHKLSYYIAQHYDIVFMENLDIQNMLKNNSSKLNMQILDQGWYQFKTFLKYKLQHLHKILIEVNPAYTSQTCSHCGHVSSKNRQTQASFKCQNKLCGLTLHADHNAAINIFHKGFYKLKLLQESFSGMEQTSTNSSVSLANIDINTILAKALSEATSFRVW